MRSVPYVLSVKVISGLDGFVRGACVVGVRIGDPYLICPCVLGWSDRVSCRSNLVLWSWKFSIGIGGASNSYWYSGN